MPPFKIGILPPGLKLPVYESLEKAKELGADGVQVPTRLEPLNDETGTPATRKEFLKKLEDLGLEISATLAGLGPGGISFAEHNPERLAKFRRDMEISAELGATIITSHIGPVPADGPSHPRWPVMQDALNQIARFTKETGVRFAIETGPETCEVLNQMIEMLDPPGVGVNLDPANLVMCAGDDPVAGVRLLKDKIIHTHAKDGVMLKNVGPEAIYLRDPKDLTRKKPDVGQGKSFQEVPLGEGNVDFPGWLRALKDVGYDYFLTIEREVGENPAADIKKAIDFLHEQMAAL